MFLFSIVQLGFKSCVPLSHNQGKVECTPYGILSVLKDISSVYIMCVNTRGVDYWLLDKYIRNCKPEQKPVIIFCKINPNIPFDKQFTVPYTPPSNRLTYYTQTYYGASLGAIYTRLKKDYTFVGTTRNATFGVFVSNAYVTGNVLYDTFLFPNVSHSQKQNYWQQLPKNRMWITVK